MSRIDIRFFDDLGIFLPHYQRMQWIQLDINGTPSIKHIIESLGIPHTEVGLVIVNNQTTNLDQIAQDCDRVLVFSHRHVGQSLRLGKQCLDPSPLFILDNHLGKLARYLRILGFDVTYRNDYTDEQLALLSNQQGRILLTRDRHLLMRKIVQLGYCLRSLEPRIQILEVLDRYHLRGQIQPFKRCLDCNYELISIDKEEILPQLEPLTMKYYDEFHICPNCNRIYWKGSHYEHMLRDVVDWLEESNTSTR